MAPKGNRRHDHGQNGGNNGAGGQNQNGNRNNGNRNPNGGGQHHRGMASDPMKCVRPQGCLEPSRLIYMEDIESGDIDVVRVTCNNLECTVGNYMHLECFNDWEKSVLNFLSSTGRARSWNVRQRIQNLWTKKGYDLAFKACDCVCGKGHLRKDLDWISPAEKQKFNRNQNNVARANAAAGAGGAAAANNANNANGGGNNNAAVPAAAVVAAAPPQAEPVVQPEVAQQNGAAGAGAGKKKKKGKTKEQRPSLALSAPIPHPNDNHKKKELQQSSSTDSGTNSWTTASTSSYSYNDLASSLSSANRPRVNSLSSNASGSSGVFSGNSCSPPSPGAIGPNMFRFQRKNSKGLVDMLAERSRNNSETGLFAKRADMRVFNVLNRVKLNNVNIKIDTLGEKSDDIRQFILSVLQQHRISKVQCVCCKDWMQVYDRCPLIDGTFFMSPRPHHAESIRVSSQDSTHPKFLNAVCMYCCTGLKSAVLCRWCRGEWTGIDLVIGSCYNYDIFAASQCCPERRQCGHCRATLNRPNFFSEASALSRCDVCGMIDFHLVHPVKEIFDIYALRC